MIPREPRHIDVYRVGVIAYDAAHTLQRELVEARKAGTIGQPMPHVEVKIIDPLSGLTKLELVRYYDEVSPHLLRHVKGRAVAQVRGPTGVGGPLFFQRHDPSADDPEAPLRMDSRQALLEAAQFNAIELHTGNVKWRAPGSADRMVFDLDPGEGVPFERVREAALLVRGLLEQMRLRSWRRSSRSNGRWPRHWPSWLGTSTRRSASRRWPPSDAKPTRGRSWRARPVICVPSPTWPPLPPTRSHGC